MSKWIPVSERLPRPGKDVLAWEDSIMHLTFWTGEEWDAIAEITHWRELPDPPEEFDDD